jgi:hypothetical protein
VAHAVEKRENGGVRADRRSEGVNGILEIVRLAAEEYEIVVLREAIGLNGRRGGIMHISERALDHKPAVSQLLGATWTHEERDVAPGLEQAPTEVSADATSSDDKDSHSMIDSG